MVRMILRRLPALSLGGLAIFMTACASVPQPPEEAVRVRAEAWLEALMQYDVDAIYSYTDPAYRSAHSARFYSKNYAGRNMWISAALGDIQCDAADDFGVCKVDVLATYRGFNMKEDMTTTLRETWVAVDGVWYTQPRQ
ncbi:MAG: hypothetical protein P8M73_01400 [Luminiphilus sp.]|nr:hypothetical protein [Luminiphilus sp.]